MNQNSSRPPSRHSRRSFLKMSGVTTGVLLLSACAAPTASPQGASESTGAGEGDQEMTTISWWNQFSSASTQEVVPQIVAQFEEENAGIKVDYELSGGPPGGGDYTEVLLTRIAGGAPPDSITLWSPPSEFGARGSLTAIDDFMENAAVATRDAFYDGPLKSCQWQGATYGLPASAGAGSIFINVEKFNEMDLSAAREDFPTTWSELAALSAQLTVWEDDDLKQAGLVPWSASWLKPVWSQLNGGNIFDATSGKYVIDSQENTDWLSFWVDWLDSQYKGDVETLNFFGEWGSVYPDSAFNLGTQAMSIAGSWACTDAEIPFEWEIAKFPAGPSGSTSLTGFWPNWWAIPTGAVHAEESFLFSEFFCTNGWVTWYKLIMDSPAWRDFPEDVFTQALVDNAGPERAKDIHDFYAGYLENSAEMWNSPIENFASDTLDAAIDEVLHKTKSPAEALAETQEIIQFKLEETVG